VSISVREAGLADGRAESRVVAQFGFFNIHVFELAGIKDFAAFGALDELGVFFAGHHLHTGMLARANVLLLLRRQWGRE
jgi:hypothetical protein